MNENIPFYIPLIFLIIIFVSLIFFLFVIKSYNSILKVEKIYFRNHFSYEISFLNHPYVKYIRIILIVLFILLLASDGLFLSFFNINNTSTFIFALFISILFALASITSLLTFAVKPYFFAMFKFYIASLFLFNTLSNGVLSILLFQSFFENIAYKIIAVLSIINFIVNIIMMVSPKLKNWDKLEMKINEKNETTFVRPKIMYLALFIWISYVTLILGTSYLLITITLVGAGI